MEEAVERALVRAASKLGSKLSYRRVEEYGDPEAGPPVAVAGLDSKLVGALERLGYRILYRFQYEALERWRRGEDLVIVSGTGTGKTEAFIVPVVDSILRGRLERVIILYPTKALARDQVWRIRRIAGEAGVRVSVLDGDTPRSERRLIYSDPPEILVTNPDMMHVGLAHSFQLRRLARSIDAVVLDEAHVYRGVFGSHVRWVLYRLERAAGDLRFILSGATIGNPEWLAERLIGRKASVVKGPGRRRGRVVHMFFDAGRASRWSLAAALAAAGEREGLKVLVFVDSQQMAEVTAKIARRSYGANVAVHRAGLPAEYRRDVEDGFREGRIRAVVATPTLELGIDIGDLDLIVMAHLPRSRSSYIQRAGRAGRRGQTGYVATIMGDDAIEAYFLRRPGEYFSQEPEPAFLEPGNREIARVHLAALLLQRAGKPVRLSSLPPQLAAAAEDLRVMGVASISGGMVAGDVGRLRRFVEEHGSIRHSGPVVEIVDDEGRAVGWREMPQALYDLYPGAIYYLGGRTYLVLSIDLGSMKARVRRIPEVNYYTKPIYMVDVSAVTPIEERDVGPLKLVYADAKVTIAVEGFTAREEYTGALVSENPFKDPIVWSYWTKAVLTRYPNPGLKSEEEALSSFHALEHALIHASKPVVGASDSDLGGISYPTGHIIIYDAAPGGHGAARLVFERFERVEDIAENILISCSCKDGCPRCVYTPYCGNSNKLLSRRGAIRVLQARMSTSREVKLDKPGGTPAV